MLFQYFLALKLLLSGKEGPYIENVSVTNIVRTEGTTNVDNSVFFQDLDLVQEYNLVINDYVTITGSAIGGNNVTAQVKGITEIDEGTYIVLDDSVSLSLEIDSTAEVSFRSQYDVWPAGAGMALDNELVDINEHLDIRSNFLSSANLDIYLTDEIEGKSLLTDEIYNPVSCFSIPRKAQSSVGIHRPPLPNETVKVLNTDTVLNSDRLKISRTINKNFYNSIIYKYDQDPLQQDVFETSLTRINADSLSRIEVGNKPLIIESKGLRSQDLGQSIANEAADRRLTVYKFGAEAIRGIKTNIKTGFDIEIGDSVIVDYESLKLSDSITGTRSGKARYYRIDNKKFNTKTGEIELDILDSNVDKDLRYGLFSPSSFVSSGLSNSQFVIAPSFNTETWGVDEFRKWDGLEGASVVVRSKDYSVAETAILQTITGNTFTLATSLTFTPPEGYIVELDIYDNQPDSVKLLYGFMTDDPTFADGEPQYNML